MNNEIIIELEKIKDGLKTNLTKQLEIKENIIEKAKELSDITSKTSPLIIILGCLLFIPFLQPNNFLMYNLKVYFEYLFCSKLYFISSKGVRIENSIKENQKLLELTKESNEQLGKEYNKLVLNLNKEYHYKEEDFINEMIDINSNSKQINSEYDELEIECSKKRKR